MKIEWSQVWLVHAKEALRHTRVCVDTRTSVNSWQLTYRIRGFSVLGRGRKFKAEKFQALNYFLNIISPANVLKMYWDRKVIPWAMIKLCQAGTETSGNKQYLRQKLVASADLENVRYTRSLAEGNPRSRTICTSL